MSDDQDGCEWVNVSSGTGPLGLSRTKGLLNGCACVCVILIPNSHRSTQRDNCRASVRRVN